MPLPPLRRTCTALPGLLLLPAWLLPQASGLDLGWVVPQFYQQHPQPKPPPKVGITQALTEIVTVQDNGLQRFGRKCEEAAPLPTFPIIGGFDRFGHAPDSSSPSLLQIGSEDMPEVAVGNTSAAATLNSSSAQSPAVSPSASAEAVPGAAAAGQNATEMFASPAVAFESTPAPTPEATPQLLTPPVVTPPTSKQPSADGPQAAQSPKHKRFGSDASGPTTAPVGDAFGDATQVLLRDAQDYAGAAEAKVLITPAPQGEPDDLEDAAALARHSGTLAAVLGVAVFSSLTSVCLILIVSNSMCAKAPPTEDAGSENLSLEAGPPATPAAIASSGAANVSDGTVVAGRASRGCGSVRQSVEALPACWAPEVEDRLPASAGYDCVLSRPLSSKCLVRVEGRVEATPPKSGAVLTAPLTREACVIYTAAVSRQLHDGIASVPVAFAVASVDFAIALLAPRAPQANASKPPEAEVRVHIDGEDVSLFEMRLGRSSRRLQFAKAPDHWQDFVLAHRTCTDLQNSAALHAEAAPLEFQECALKIGSVVTLVGEVHRGADGLLSMRPLESRWTPEAEHTADSPSTYVNGGSPTTDGGSSPSCLEGTVRKRVDRGEREPWRTSWEQAGCGGADSLLLVNPSEVDSRFEKVLVSDDPSLLSGRVQFAQAEEPSGPFAVARAAIAFAGFANSPCAADPGSSSTGS